MNAVRSRLTYANVIAMIGVFAARKTPRGVDRFGRARDLPRDPEAAR